MMNYEQFINSFRTSKNGNLVVLIECSDGKFREFHIKDKWSIETQQENIWMAAGYKLTPEQEQNRDERLKKMFNGALRMTYEPLINNYFDWSKWEQMMIELTNEQWQRAAESEDEADKVIKENYKGTDVYLNGEEYTIPYFSEMYGWQHLHISAKELHRLALEKILGGVD